MNNKKRYFVAIVFVLCLFFLMTFAGGNDNEETLNVEFIDGFDNSLVDSQNIEIGSDAVVPDDPKHSDYVFVGWFLYDDRDSKVTDFDNIRDDLKVIALYGGDKNNNGIVDDEDKSYSVSFIDSVTNNVIDTQSVLVGMDAVVPEVPFHEGYTFTGWSSGYTNIQKDLTVSAQFRTEEQVNDEDDDLDNEEDDLVLYVVTFIDGDSGRVIGTQNVEEGNAASLPKTPIYENRIFKFWDGEYRNVRSNRTITAVYADDKNKDGIDDSTQPHYDVTYYDYNNEVIKSEKVLVNMPTPSISNPVRDNYEFVGWSPDVLEFVVDKADYKAQYKPLVDKNENGIADDEEEKYEVSYAVDNNIIKTFSNLLYGDETPIVDLDPIKDGFVFINWGNVSKTVTSSVTYNAIFAEDVNGNKIADSEDERYVIGYLDENDKLIDSFSNLLVNTNTPSLDENKIPQKDGYVFDGWIDFSDKVVKSIDYKPNWTLDIDKDGKADRDEIEIVFQVGDEKVDIQYLQKGDTPVAPILSKDGYVLSPWMPSIATVSENAIYNAMWLLDTNKDGYADQNQFRIIFKALDKELVNNLYNKGDKMPIPTKNDIPQKDGYTFVGWGEEVDKTVSENKEFIAVYEVDINGNDIPDDEEKKIKITFLNKDGSVFETLYELVGMNTPLPDNNPISDGYVFDGWDGFLDIVKDDIVYNSTWLLDTDKDGMADKNEIKIVFRVDEKEVKTQYLKAGEMPSVPELMKEGYVLSAWAPSIVAASEDKTYNAMWLVDVNGNNQADEVESRYSVKYYDGDNKLIKSFDNLLVNTATPVLDKNLLPKRDGYVFSGWIDFSSVVKGNTEYRPNFDADIDKDGKADKDEIKIVFKIDNEIVNTQYLQENDMPLAPSIKKDGYVLSQWSPKIEKVRESLTYNASWLVDSDKDGYADESQYKVVFVVGDTILKTLYLYENEDVDVPSVPSELIPAGKAFDRWSSNVEKNKSETYVAIFGDDKNNNGKVDSSEDTVTVKFLNKDGSLFDSYESIVNVPTIIPENNPVSDGYVFNGWDSVNKIVTKDISYKSIWLDDVDKDGVADIIQYKVEFSVDGTIIDTQYLNKDEVAVSPSIPEKLIPNSKVFSGWSPQIKANYKGVYNVVWEDDINNNGEADINEEKVAIHYLNKDGSIFETLYQYEKLETPIPDNNPVAFGFVFNGWDSVSKIVNTEVSYNAKWLVDSDNDGYADEKQIEVKFDVDGTIVSTQYLNKDEVPVSPSIPEDLIPNSKVFNGWTPELKANYDGVYNVVWENDINNNGKADSLDKKYTVSYVDYNDNVLDSMVVLENMPTPTTNVKPQRDGYVFIGFGELDELVLKDTTYIAQYDIDKNNDGIGDNVGNQVIHEVKFYLDDRETLIGDIQYILDGDDAIAPNDPIKNGYDFIGWDRDYTNVSENINVIAVFEDKSNPTLDLSVEYKDDKSSATIKVIPNDDGGVKTVKYIIGDASKEDFDKNGIEVNSPYEIEVIGNAKYSVYVEDESGNYTVDTIEVKDIEIAANEKEDVIFQDEYVNVSIDRIEGWYKSKFSITALNRDVSIQKIRIYRSEDDIVNAGFELLGWAKTKSRYALESEFFKDGEYVSVPKDLKEENVNYTPGDTEFSFELTADDPDRFTIYVVYDYKGKSVSKLYKLRLARFVKE